jgi:hypothetical protein
MRALHRLLGLGQWRVICPVCKGTGICQSPGCRWPHSCCGDCKRKRVPWSSVPADFDGKNHNEYQRISPDGVLIGVGWVWGSFWQGLQRGFYHGN